MSVIATVYQITGLHLVGSVFVAARADSNSWSEAEMSRNSASAGSSNGGIDPSPVLDIDTALWKDQGRSKDSESSLGEAESREVTDHATRHPLSAKAAGKQREIFPDPTKALANSVDLVPLIGRSGSINISSIGRHGADHHHDEDVGFWERSRRRAKADRNSWDYSMSAIRAG